MSNENEDIWTAFKRVLAEHGPIEIEPSLDKMPTVKLLKQAVEAEQELAFLKKCIHYVWENDLNEEFFKYFAGQDGQGPIVVSVNCNDLFFWGCSDEEQVTPENFPLLEKAYQDLLELGEVQGYVNSYIMGLLFCCMSREMRPQTPYYYQIKRQYWPLFNACGPVREGQADVEEYVKAKTVSEKRMTNKEWIEEVLPHLIEKKKELGNHLMVLNRDGYSINSIPGGKEKSEQFAKLCELIEEGKKLL